MTGATLRWGLQFSRFCAIAPQITNFGLSRSFEPEFRGGSLNAQVQGISAFETPRDVIFRR